MAMDTKQDRTAWITGKAACPVGPPPWGRAFRLVLLGAPGAGKGTQAEKLGALLGGCQLSTGDIFRAARSMDPTMLSPKALEAVNYMKAGELVPDDTVIELVRERVECLTCRAGFMLDGFPRTIPQADALDDLLQQHEIAIDAVLSYELGIDTVVERLGGRRTCTVCKTTFHIVNMPPAKEGVCDKCGGELYQRVDDQPDSIRVRLRAYEESTSPLTNHYSEKGLLVKISAEGSPQEVFERTLKALQERYPELRKAQVK